MPGCSGQENGYVPSVVNRSENSSPGSRVSLPHVPFRPSTMCAPFEVFRNRTAVPTGTRAIVGAKLHTSMRTTVAGPSV